MMSAPSRLDSPSNAGKSVVCSARYSATSPSAPVTRTTCRPSPLVSSATDSASAVNSAYIYLWRSSLHPNPPPLAQGRELRSPPPVAGGGLGWGQCLRQRQRSHVERAGVILDQQHRRLFVPAIQLCH